MLVVGLVAVDVHHQAVLGGQPQRKLYRAHAVLARDLEVRDRAHAVRAYLDGAPHQRLAVWEREDALLRERHELKGHLTGHLVP
jgi:hypothetical protein